jgi:hypothetical protein
MFSRPARDMRLMVTLSSLRYAGVLFDVDPRRLCGLCGVIVERFRKPFGMHSRGVLPTTALAQLSRGFRGLGEPMGHEIEHLTLMP